MDGQALYYGMNALSNNVIMADRKKLKSANGMYLGSTWRSSSSYRSCSSGVFAGSSPALTQNVKDLLASREIENILDNTDFMILLSQAQSDRAILAKQIGISEHQLSYITQSNSGEGLLFYGSVTIPFVDRFPRGEIYDLLTTKAAEKARPHQADRPDRRT